MKLCQPLSLAIGTWKPASAEVMKDSSNGESEGLPIAVSDHGKNKVVNQCSFVTAPELSE